MHEVARVFDVNNMRVLHHLSRRYASVQTWHVQIRAAQRRYYSSSRDPAVLLPTPGIPPAVAEEFKALYAAARVGDKLEWIKRYREDHHLHYCPMCGGTGVSDLDHVLPKANYPELAFFSHNLVPTCVPCNRRRLNKGARYHLVHPYFDGALLNALRLRVTFQPQFDAVRFGLEVDGLQGSDLTRMREHIRRTLPILVFRRHMRTEWNEWHRKFQKRGARARHQLNEEIAEATPANCNSWRLAFLRGLLADAKAVDWMLSEPES